MLDKRLLTSLEDVELKEDENLQRMKERFGENSLHSCEVMLKDIQESIRLNKLFRESQSSHNTNQMLQMQNLKVNIVSPTFWP